MNGHADLDAGREPDRWRPANDTDRQFSRDWGRWCSEWEVWKHMHEADLRRCDHGFPAVDRVLGTWHIQGREVQVWEVDPRNPTYARPTAGVTVRNPDGTYTTTLVGSFRHLEEALGIATPATTGDHDHEAPQHQRTDQPRRSRPSRPQQDPR